MDNIVLHAFLELCSIFKDSNIWLDQQALNAYEHKKDANVYDYPMLLLYYPVCKMSEYWNKVNNGEVLNVEDKENIKEIANQIWYAVDCRNDVKNATSNDIVFVRNNVLGILETHFNINLSNGVCRNQLHIIASKVWGELGGYDEYNNI